MRFAHRSLLAALLAAVAVIFVMAAPASAHVVPSTIIALDVHADDITATVTLPSGDLSTASGIAISAAETLPTETTHEITAYLEDHFHVATGSKQWSVEVYDVTASKTEQWGTGAFHAVTAEVVLTPPDSADLRAFTVDYDAIVHQVVTADIFVVLHSDWASGQVETSRALGSISLDTVTGTISPLTVDLDEGNGWQGFLGMVRLGIAHIADGTDHQLFLLTLLLPAPLLAVSGRWRSVTGNRHALRRIGAITIAFTIGHSVTLASGALGLQVPQQPVEALIAVSILVAAAHAVRPLFPGREPVVAGFFGLVHGMAFSATLSSLDLSGSQLVLSVLGFNLGIELMQLAVVLLALPPLVALARWRGYGPLRLTAAVLTAVAAVGWLIDRVGLPNALGTAADSLGQAAPYVVALLWLTAALHLLRVHPKPLAPGGRSTPGVRSGDALRSGAGESRVSSVRT